MIDFGAYFEHLRGVVGSDFTGRLERSVAEVLDSTKHGDFERWMAALGGLPGVKPSVVDFDRGAVRIGAKEDMSESQREALREGLMEFHPWRKGPFEVFGESIDTEWRSDMKWARIEGAIGSLEGKAVLDVGSGNGYYAFRMLGKGARAVVAVDPMLLYVMQFLALNRFAGQERAAVLPLKFEQVPEGAGVFDVVFSMGVLYHQKEPVEHIRRLGGFLKAGGRLVLETLILQGEEREVLEPKSRYGKMRNVWQIPSAGVLCEWLEGGGFCDVAVVDITPTTVAEQRTTEWMRFESLADFLDPEDSSRTIEGYPGPVRAVVLARK